jgi:hypothetical protein
MSDFILKFWPKENVSENQTELIKAQFKKDKIISDEIEFWGKPAFKSGQRLGEMVGINNENYTANLVVQIEEKGYGVEQGEEDFEYVDRNNVVSIKNGDGDGEMEKWSEFENYLSELTKNEYKGGWELL